MGEWYTIGLAIGLGVGVGVLLAGFLSGSRRGTLAAGVLGAAAGVGIGFLIENWNEAVGGGAGAVRSSTARSNAPGVSPSITIRTSFFTATSS